MIDATFNCAPPLGGGVMLQGTSRVGGAVADNVKSVSCILRRYRGEYW